MNKNILLSFLFLCLGGLSQYLYAQADRQYFADDSHTIFVPKRTVLNVLQSDYEVEKILDARKTDEGSDRYVGNSGLLKNTKVSNNMDIPVIGFIKSDPSLDEYDYYIVEYDGQVCFLSKESCPDNTLIDSKNKDIRDYYQSLKKDITTLTKEYFERVKSKAQSASDRITILKNREDYLVDSLAESQIAQQEKAVLEKYTIWKEGADETRKKASNALIIHRSKLSAPNSAAGCDYSMTFTNTSSKTIKYLDWKGSAYNAVDDIVSCEVRNTRILQGRVTGPINPNTEHKATWETIIYNWSAKELRLSGIEITYTDGTKTSLSSKDISSIINAPSNQLPFTQKVSIRSQAKDVIKHQLDELNDVSKYLSAPENARFSTTASLEGERDLYKQLIELGKEFQRLRHRNNLPEWVLPKDVKALIGTYIY